MCDRPTLAELEADEHCPCPQPNFDYTPGGPDDPWLAPAPQEERRDA